MKTLGAAAETGERWALEFHTPEADSMDKTTRPVTPGGSVLPRGSEGRCIESCTGQSLRKTCVGGEMPS